jgi:hypothetical protein
MAKGAGESAEKIVKDIRRKNRRVADLEASRSSRAGRGA